MRAVHARRSAGHGLYRVGEAAWQFDLFAGTREELRPNTSAQVLIFAPEFEGQIALHTAKEFFGTKLGAVPNLHRNRPVPRNAQLICSGNT